MGIRRITYEGACDVSALIQLLRDHIRVGDVIAIEPDPSGDSITLAVDADLTWERRDMIDRAIERASGRAPMPKRRGRKV